MSNNESIDTIEKLKKHVKGIEADIKKLKIPIINGTVDGTGCCFVGLETELFSAHKELFTEGSLCVKNVDHEFYSRIQYSIRLGSSNTWVYLQHIKAMHDVFSSDEDDDWDDEDVIDDEDEEHPQLTELSIAVASSKGFSGLKNVSQRRTHTSQYLKYQKIECTGNDVFEIANLAENYLDMAITPMLAKQLNDEGLSIKEICERLGLSKLKATRAVNYEIPEHMQEQLDIYYKVETAEV